MFEKIKRWWFRLRYGFDEDAVVIAAMLSGSLPVYADYLNCLWIANTKKDEIKLPNIGKTYRDFLRYPNEEIFTIHFKREQQLQRDMKPGTVFTYYIVDTDEHDVYEYVGLFLSKQIPHTLEIGYFKLIKFVEKHEGVFFGGIL